MGKLIEPRVLKGFRDFLPETEIERKRIQGILEKTFESFGFVPIDTPVLEYTEVLLGKGGGETDKQIYRFLDNGERDVALRFDLTVPFARFMAGHRQELYLPFKRYHIAKVFRGENTQRGRYREFTQCDFDIVGTDSVSADFEILLLMYTSLKALGVEEFSIHFSNRAVFNRFLGRMGMTEKSADVLRIVDKLKKIGESNVMEQLTEITSRENAERVIDFIRPEASFEETLKKLSNLAGGDAEDTRRLSALFSYIRELGLEQHYRFDPSITRGLDYYTGIVFETFLGKLPEIGSVCSGGRYNNLASLYTKEEIPGVGSSIGLDRLMAALEELKGAAFVRSGTKVLVLCLEQKLTGLYHKMAEAVRKQGYACEVYPDAKKLNIQFSFAEKKGIPLVLICGEEEAKNNTVNIKNVTSRESFDGLPFTEGLKKIRELLG